MILSITLSQFRSNFYTRAVFLIGLWSVYDRLYVLRKDKIVYGEHQLEDEVCQIFEEKFDKFSLTDWFIAIH